LGVVFSTDPNRVWFRGDGRSQVRCAQVVGEVPVPWAGVHVLPGAFIGEVQRMMHRGAYLGEYVRRGIDGDVCRDVRHPEGPLE
jgi:hypothetical protein